MSSTAVLPDAKRPVMAVEKKELTTPEELVAAPPGGIMNAVVPLDYNSRRIRKLFLDGEATLKDHVHAINASPQTYIVQLHTMVERKLAASFTFSAKGRILAACFVAKQQRTVDFLLKVPGLYGIAEVLKCVQVLDAPRRVRQLKKKLERLEVRKQANPKAVRPRTITNLKTTIHNIQKEDFLDKASLSGASARRLRKWCARIPAVTLEFFLLNYPTEPWKSLADLLHLKASDFKLDYFLPMIFGAAPPQDSVFSVADSVTKDNLRAVLEKYPRLCHCYSYLRKKLNTTTEDEKKAESRVRALTDMGFLRHQAEVAVARHSRYTQLNDLADWILDNDATIAATAVAPERKLLTAEAATFLAARAPLEDLVWFYEELASNSGVADIITQRLKNGEKIEAVQSRANYGKLMERLLTFREMKVEFAPLLLPHAESKLAEISVPRIDQLKLAVLGDASGSMEVAIKTATTLGSLLSVALNADLYFFNEERFKPPCIPRTAAEVIKVVESVPAKGATSMASALWPYYESRTPVDLFILVSDEGENVKYNGYFFAELFKKYREEVHPNAKVFLVSFLQVGQVGVINQRMADQGIACKQFRLDPVRPDTSKFDALLGLVTMETSELKERWESVEEALGPKGYSKDLVNLILEY